MPPKTPEEIPAPFADEFSLYYSKLFNQENFDRIPVRDDLFSKEDRKFFAEHRDSMLQPPKTDLITLKTMYQKLLRSTSFITYCYDEIQAAEHLRETQEKKLAIIRETEGVPVPLADSQIVPATQMNEAQAVEATREAIVRAVTDFASDDPAIRALSKDKDAFAAELRRRQEQAVEKLRRSEPLKTPAMIEEEWAPKIAAAQRVYENAQAKVHPFDRFCENNKLLEVHLDWLERSNNWAQILFPTDTLNDDEPMTVILSDLDRYQLSKDQNLQNTLLFNFAIAMKFYGFNFSVTPDDATYCFKLTKPANSTRWAHKDFAQHNYTRITRILRSLQLAGLNDMAALFLNALETMRKDTAFKIPEECYKDWRRAARGTPAKKVELPRVDVRQLGDVCKAVHANIQKYQAHLDKPKSIIATVFATIFATEEDALNSVKRKVCESLMDAVYNDDAVLALAAVAGSKPHGDEIERGLAENFYKAVAIAQGILQVGGKLTQAHFSSQMKGLALDILKKRDELYFRPKADTPAADRKSERRYESFSTIPPI